ncbi:unnamed protein product [Caenorhabditis sp. 36 PRJEB53466]|nr:unnamed protein product [Caenorhabditis sp. 36 PRJEB53466]
MLPVKKVVSQTLSILGRAVAPAEQLALIKSSGADREVKDLLRQCLITAIHFQSASKENLEKSKTLVRKSDGDVCEISSRAAAFTAASAMKLKKWSDVEEMLQMTKSCPPAITSSIRIRALAEQSKLDEALAELENVLIFEEDVFGTANYCVSDEALDSLCEAIKSQPETAEKMKRFRSLQRLVTKYGRRTEKSIEELLFAPIRLENAATSSADDEEFVKSDRFGEFVKQIPYLNEQSEI